MTPMDQLSAATVLASYERDYELATVRYLRARTWDERAAAWERRDDLAKVIRGHCKAFHLIPTVAATWARDEGVR